MNNKILLTGSTGYLGRHLSKALIQNGFEVITVGRSNSTVQWTFEQGEIKETHGADTIIHCAWDMKVSSEVENTSLNIEGTKKLIQSCVALQVKKIIFISTTSAFAGAQTTYGKSKLQLEQWLEQYQAVVIRPGLLWGKDCSSMMQSLEKIILKLPVVPVFGSKQLFFTTEVNELCNSIVRIAKDPILYQKDFPVIASSKPITFIEILKKIALRANKRRVFIPVPWRPIYWLLKGMEALNFRPPFKSDSLLSLMTLSADQRVNQNFSISSYL